MAHETAGDPVSGLKWTRRTTAKLADELHGLGIDVCPQTVARLLKAMGYSLRVNHKKLAGASHPTPKCKSCASHRTASSPSGTTPSNPCDEKRNLSSFSGFRGRCQNFDLYKFRNCGITLA